jgi:hypothetical protein
LDILRKYLHMTGHSARKPEQNRRIAFRNRITPQEAIDALVKNAGQLSLAGESLGVSRGSMHQMMKRYPSVAKAARDAEARMTDIAVVQMHKLVLEKDFRACAHWLNTNPDARARGWGAQGATVNIDAAPRHTTLMLEVLPPTGRTFDHATGQIIELKAIEANAVAEDELVVDDVTKPEDDDTPDEAA